MMLKLPSSPTSLSSSSSSSCNAALIRKQCRSFGASSDSPSRLKVLIRRRNYAVSCEAADSSASSSAPLVAETKEKDASGRVGKSAADRLQQGSLTEDGLSYNEKFIVRCYEVGVNKTATVETIANLLQEVACNHVQSLGFSTDGFGTTTTMRKLHLIWATARMHIEIYKYPAWSDVVEIETWYESEGPIWTRRDWILKDYATREVIGRATSKFVMMNQHTRRLEKVSDDVRKEYLGFCPREPRLAFPEEKNGSLKKIAKLEDAALYSRQGLVPRRADLDMNQHVNNVAYIGWLLEEVAGNHVQSCGYSTDGFGTTTTMRKLHLIWVATRMHIEIYKYPARSDVVEIESWFESKGGIGIRRDWILKDYATHEVLGRATSKFVMINQDTRKPAKVSDDVRKEYLGFSPREPRYKKFQ